jgi:uncharacterized protein involved in exopolysaccharide biosynthesis
MLDRNIASPTPRDLVHVLFRYKWRGMAFFAILMTLVVVGLSVSPNKYVSEAKLFVRMGRENVALDPTATTGSIIALDASREREINSVVEMLGSRALIEKVVEAVTDPRKLATPLQREKVIADLTDNCSAWSLRQSAVVSVICEAETPEQARTIVDTLVGLYLEEHMRVNRAPRSYGFFDEQSKLLSKELAEAQTALRDAKNEYGIASISGRRTALEKQISDVETHSMETDAALRASEAKIGALQNSLEGLPPALVRQLVDGQPSDGLANMRQHLYELEVREQELLSKYTENHPFVIAIHRQVEEADKIFRQEKPASNKTTAAVVMVDIANRDSLRARAESLTRQKVQLHEELRTLNDQEIVIA